ncbi:MAG: hypothetical protein U0359_34905 [Byssovorax sp.]
MTRAPRSAACVAVLLAAIAPARASAQSEQAAAKAAAQALFDEAREMTAKGNYDEACPKLLESARLDPSVGTTFYLADCYEHVGMLASAWTYYIEAAGAAQAAGQKERADFAQKRADTLKPRLTKIAISVPDQWRALPGLKVERDEMTVGPALWGTAVPVDPGRHGVTASAPGMRTWMATIEATEEGKTVTVEISLAPKPNVDPGKPITPPPPAGTPPSNKPPPAASSSTPPPPPPTAAPRARIGAQRIAGIAIGAAGIAGLGLGAAFGAIAIGKQGDSNNGPCDADNFCSAEGKTLRKEAISAATISTAAFIAGGVALAGGVTLYLTAPSPAPSAKTPAKLTFGPGRLTFEGTF